MDDIDDGDIDDEDDIDDGQDWGLDWMDGSNIGIFKVGTNAAAAAAGGG